MLHGHEINMPQAAHSVTCTEWQGSAEPQFLHSPHHLVAT